MSPAPVSSSSMSPEPVPSSAGPLMPCARMSPEPLDGGEIAAEVVDCDVAGATVQVERDRCGRGDVVVDADVVEELVIVGSHRRGWCCRSARWGVFDDALDASLNVAEDGPAGVDVADDVNLAVAAGMDGDVPGARGDDTGRADRRR